MHPWRRFGRDWPELTVRFVDLGATWGITRWVERRPVEVLMHCRLNQVERRVTIAHECEHLDRGAPCQSLQASIEARVLQDTARYLLPDVELLAETLAVYDLRRAADELFVTFPVLVDRLNGLSDAESLYVHQRREDVA